MSNVTTKTPAGLSKPAKIAIWVAVVLLVAALAFGIVWTSIDHSYRYDLEDLSVFFKEGAVIDYDGLDALPITLETSVTRDSYLKKVYTNIKAIDGLDAYKEKNADLSGAKLPYPDIVYMYYEIFRADEEGNIEDLTPILSNTAYYDSAKAKEVRLGNGDLHTLIENYMRYYPEYSTEIIRNEDTGDAIGEGYTLVIELTATYETETTKDGETTTSTSKYLTLSDYNLELGTEEEIAAKKAEYYVGISTFKDMLTEVKDHKVPEAVSTALLEEFAKLEKNGDEFTLVQEIKLTSGSNDVTEVTFKGKVKSNFKAEVKHQTFKLSEQYILNDAGDGFIKNDGATDFEYKDSSGTTQKIDRSKQLVLRITVDSVIKLNEALVLELTKENGSFEAPTNVGENKDAAYALQYMEYVKKTMIDEAVATIKKDEATLAGDVKNALWEEITHVYANNAFITSFPEGEVEKYCEALMEAYDSEFKSSGLNYANTTEYVLIKIYEVPNVSTMTADEQAAKLNEKLTEAAEEALRKEILLFWLADYFDIEITKAAKKAAEKELYDAYYSAYLQLYTSYYSTVYSSADIARLARQDAEAQVESICTPAYLREYVALTAVQDALVRDAKNYPNITWTLSGEADHDHEH